MNVMANIASRLRGLLATTALGLGVAVAASAATGLVGDTAQAATPDFSNTALRQLDNLVKGDSAAVVHDLDPTLQRQLSSDGIAKAWGQFEQAHGKYLFHGPTASRPQGEITVVTVPLGMARQPGRFEISFHRDGHIAGLWLLRG